MSTFNVPLELTNEFITKYGFDLNDGYLDLYQIFSLLNHQNISFLYPDNATKIFTQIYNNEDNRIFEHFFNDISTNSNTAVVYIKTIDDRDDPVNRENRVYVFFNGKQYSSKTKLSVNHLKVKWGINALAIIIEYSDSINAAFGHYGGAIYDFNESADKLLMFDSMMNTDSNDDEASLYSTIFTEIIKNEVFVFDYLGNADPQVIFDIYRTPDSIDSYPLEITGGAIELENYFIENKKLKNKSKINRYIHCTDNQNQFCYMWVFLYVSFKLCKYYKQVKGRNTSNFIGFHKKICKLKCIPLVIIKTFIFNTFYLDYIKSIPIIEKCLELANPAKYALAEECFFMRYFKTLTALDTIYPDASSKNSKMRLYSIENLNSIDNTQTQYKSIFDVVLNMYTSITINDITEHEIIKNDTLIDFVRFQLSNVIEPKTNEYKLISGEQNIQSITMDYFNFLANEYETDIFDNPEYAINRENYLKFNP